MSLPASAAHGDSSNPLERYPNAGPLSREPSLGQKTAVYG